MMDNCTGTYVFSCPNWKHKRSTCRQFCLTSERDLAFVRAREGPLDERTRCPQGGAVARGLCCEAGRAKAIWRAPESRVRIVGLKGLRHVAFYKPSSRLREVGTNGSSDRSGTAQQAAAGQGGSGVGRGEGPSGSALARSYPHPQGPSDTKATASGTAQPEAAQGAGSGSSVAAGSAVGRISLSSSSLVPLQVVGANLGDASKAADFLRRSIANYGDLRALGSALGRARATGRTLRIAVVGGSTSNGGGYTQCGKPASACGAACCGRGYVQELAHLLGRAGISTHVTNKARGGTGPDLLTVCLRTAFAGTNLSAIDLFLVEYAINTSPACAGSGFGQVVTKADRLLWRIRANAPQAAVVFAHTFALDAFVDSSACWDTLALWNGLPSVSLKAGLWPLLVSGELRPVDVLQPAAFHHPNVRGHQLMACALLDLMLQAERRFGAGQHAAPSPVVREPSNSLGPPPKPISLELHRAMLLPEQTRCADVQSGTADAMLASSTGWRLDGKQRYLYASDAGAELNLRVPCESASGCALSVGLSESYQPLGVVEAFVDGAFVAAFNLASLALRQAKRFITVEKFYNVLPFAWAKAGEVRGTLAQGEHTLTLRAAGASEDWTATWWSNYSRHEVHFRSIAVMTIVSDCLGFGCKPPAKPPAWLASKDDDAAADANVTSTVALRLEAARQAEFVNDTDLAHGDGANVTSTVALPDCARG